VGASLLAKAVCHPTLMLPDTLHSRAGSLPHNFRRLREAYFFTNAEHAAL
jgi:hypothetical protein